MRAHTKVMCDMQKAENSSLHWDAACRPPLSLVAEFKGEN